MVGPSTSPLKHNLEVIKIMLKYMLERAEMYILPSELTKNRICQTIRWKQVAMSDDLDQLKSVMGNNHRIIDRELNVICKTRN